ncbi:MAG TPA: penicillin acylase family protein [Solirubrobacteraceae bacterium]|nr:penicillin acylase family protein [Solirubrobacteraceae bacterium]
MREGALGTGTVRSQWGRGLKRALTGALACCLLLVIAALPASASAEPFEDFSGGAYQILPPGAEGGTEEGKYSQDQAKLYEKLTPKAGKVTQELIEKDFLVEKFGVNTGGGVLRVEKPEAGLEIVRDKHDIPHITGATRGEVMFGSGWVAAKDRGLLLQLGLGPAYTAAVGIPGINAFGLLLNERSFTPSAEAISFVTNQKKVLEEKGPEGEQVITDLENWVDGVNGYEQTLPEFERLKKVTFADAIAGFAFIGSIFGNGGGNEVHNSEFLARLENKMGAEGGKEVFKDLREVNDPEAPTTGTKPFPYDQEPTGATPGALLVEPGTQSSAAVKAEQAFTAGRRKASNFLLAGAADTANGHPKAVMGPQLGYYYPEIVMQADLHGPGIDAQGVVAPISPYVFIGRGKDFAWSLTSAGSENTQQFLEKLCNADESPPTRESTSYVHDGECVPMHKFDAGKLGAGEGQPAREVEFEETIHGPVSGTVLVEGQPYAIANDRSTRGREPAGEVAFSKLDSDKVHNPQEFFEAANELETTFNMAYIDNEHIGFISTGRLPVLAAGTNPSLPTLGTGEYDWKGFLSLEQHPHEVDPISGHLTNWNNKPAPEWGAASDEYSYGPVHRVQMFTGFKEGMTEADDAAIMNKAATQDLRAVKDWPLIEEVLNTPGPAPSALALEARKTVAKWVAKGASRYGKEGPKAPAAAILDTAWTPIGEAVLSPVLGDLLPELASIQGPNNGENSQGSSYGSGWYGYVYKGLKQVLGQTLAQPLSHGYCGSGELEACRNSLWSAIQGAAEKLQTEQGSEMKAWRAAKVRITFLPGILKSRKPPHESFTMSWTNRSTFQQIIEFTGHGASE